MNKFLHLKFDGAGLFRDKSTGNKGAIDYVYDYIDKKTMKRDSMECFVEPITPYQISNVIHVLFGKQPVPSLRKSIFKIDDYYWEKALNSYLKYDTINNFKLYNKEIEFPSETIRTKKSKYNSFLPNSILLTHEIIFLYINNRQKYYNYITFLNNILNFNVLEIRYEDLITIVREQSREIQVKIYEYINNMRNCSGLNYAFGFDFKRTNNLKKISKSEIISKLYSGNSEFPISSARFIVNGIANVYKLSGDIFVPVNDDDINILKTQSTGTCKILDGGFVWIKKLINDYDFNPDDYILVKTISTEKFKPMLNNNPKQNSDHEI